MTANLFQLTILILAWAAVIVAITALIGPTSARVYPKLERTLLVVEALRNKLEGFKLCGVWLVQVCMEIETADDKHEVCKNFNRTIEGNNCCLNDIRDMQLTTDDVGEVKDMMEVLTRLFKLCRI